MYLPYFKTQYCISTQKFQLLDSALPTPEAQDTHYLQVPQEDFTWEKASGSLGKHQETKAS